MEFVINPDGSMSPKQPGSGDGDAHGAQPHPQATPMGAPEAPAPIAMKRIDAKPTSGWTSIGATSRPTSAVKTTRDITRGFNKAT